MLINIALFQVGWFACVLGGRSGWHWIGTVTVAAIVIWHLHRANRPAPEFVLIATAMSIGVAWDSLLVATGLLQYRHGQIHTDLAPHWIVAMWAAFATTFNVSLRWLRQRWILAATFGAIGGPAAYYAGYRLGAVQLPNLSLALATLGVGWAALMPLLMVLSRRLDGFGHRHTM